MINLQVNIRYCNPSTQKIKHIRTLQSVYKRGRLVNMLLGLILDSVKNIYLDTECLDISDDNRYFDLHSIVTNFNDLSLNDEFNKLLIRQDRFKVFMCLDIYIGNREDISKVSIETVNYTIKNLHECGFTSGDFLT